MARISIDTAWNETAAFVRRDPGTLFLIAFAMIALPSVALQALTPSPQPGQAPSALAMLLLPVVAVLSIAGTIAVSSLALGREQVVGSAIRHGFRRMPALLAVFLLFFAALVAVTTVFLVGFGVDVVNRGAEAMMSGSFLLVFLLLGLVLLFFSVRLMLMTPVAAAEAGGPIAIIRRSWALTAGHFWKLLGFVLIALVLLLVVSLAATFIVAIPIYLVSGGEPQPGSLAHFIVLLVSGILNAAFVVLFTTMVARIYLQVAGDSTAFE